MRYLKKYNESSDIDKIDEIKDIIELGLEDVSEFTLDDFDVTLGTALAWFGLTGTYNIELVEDFSENEMISKMFDDLKELSTTRAHMQIDKLEKIALEINKSIFTKLGRKHDFTISEDWGVQPGFNYESMFFDEPENRDSRYTKIITFEFIITI